MDGWLEKMILILKSSEVTWVYEDKMVTSLNSLFRSAEYNSSGSDLDLLSTQQI